MQTRAFTLLELVMVVAIIGIMAGMALSYSGYFRRRLELNQVTRQLFSGVSLARAQAMRQSTDVTFFVLNQQRLIAFIDKNKNKAFDPNQDTLIFRYPESQLETLPVGMRIFAPALEAAAGAGQVRQRFNFQGFSLDDRGNFVAAVYCILDNTINMVYTVQLTVAGAAQIDRTNVSMCTSTP